MVKRRIGKQPPNSGHPQFSHGMPSICFCIALILTIGFFISCSNKTSAPEGILSQDEMAKVMTEFYLKESKINSLHLNQDSAVVLFQYYRQAYAKENNLPDSVIERSYQYYLNNPLELSGIYDRIIDSLALKEQRATVPVKTQ
jgi:hypothetical protein